MVIRSLIEQTSPDILTLPALKDTVEIYPKELEITEFNLTQLFPSFSLLKYAARIAELNLEIKSFEMIDSAECQVSTTSKFSLSLY